MLSREATITNFMQSCDKVILSYRFDEKGGWLAASTMVSRQVSVIWLI
jgi:hypothetical protein